MDLQINRMRQNISTSSTSRVVGTGAPMTTAAVAAASMHQQQNQPASGWGTTSKTLADYVKESAWQSSIGTIGSNSNQGNSFAGSIIGGNNHHHNSTTSMPWAAAVKSPPDHHQQQQQHHHHHHQQQQQQQHHHQQHHAAAAMSANSFDYNGGSIGSWSSPETSSSNRGGWNVDGTLKNGDATFDDGTAIWGNPTTKKTGVDWAEKESLVESTKKSANTGASQAGINSEKRIQKPEPTISSLNGTEAWGAPLSNSQLSSTKINNDNSGNNSGFGQPVAKGSDWGELSPISSLSSSLQQKNSIISNERNSSPPNSDCSVWNNLGISKQKSSDWLSSSSGIGGSSGNSASAGSRLDELNKQLESTNLFDSSSTSSSSSSTSATTTLTKTGSSSTGSNNPNLEHQSHNTIGLSLGNGGAMGNGCNNIGASGSGINDLRQQMSANFSNDLLDSPNGLQRQQGVVGNSSTSNNNHQSQQLDFSSAAAAAAAAAAEAAAASGTPSRDLLKQMVHQIQLAVQAGHLNAHILNQPMSTPTLQLVYQLLQQIKTLNQLQEIQQRAGIRPTDMTSAPSNMDLQINKIRQQISLLQKAISVQQAALAKGNESIGDLNNINKQQANNYSYATISKLSTNSKVPSNNMSNIISNSNLDSFRRSSLIDTLSNGNSDSLRSAQATFDANATIDKTFSSLIQQASPSVANNILGSGKTATNQSGETFSKASSEFEHQADTKNVGLFSAQPSSSSTSSSSNAAWSAFSSGNNFVSQQAWPSQLRISSNVSQDHNQYSAFDMVPDFGPSKTWRGSSILSSEDKDNNINTNNSNMAPGIGSNISLTARPSSASNANKNTSGNALKEQQMKRNDINNRDSSLFCDWGNNSDSGKGNFDQISNTDSNFSNGGLSLQSNPWMFAPTSSSLNIGSGMDRIISKNSSCGDNYITSNKLDNGNTDKMAGDPSLFLKSSTAAGVSNNAANIQRSSGLYDWGDLASTTLQYNVDNTNINKQQQQQQQQIGGSRPAPPPGLLSNFGPLIGSSSGSSSAVTNGMNSIMDHPNKLLVGGLNESDSVNAQLQSRESSANLWSSGTWFD